MCGDKKMEFKMKAIGCKDAYDELNGLVSKESEYKRLEVLKGFGNDFVVYKSLLDVKDITIDVLKQVIGKDGCYFILTTENCDIDFIWHNRKTKNIEFWGPKDNIQRAINEIQYRINKIGNHKVITIELE